MSEPRDARPELLEIRRSNVHGLGAFAVQPIPKGTRLIEYAGERVSHREADRRYEEKDANDSHTFLFIVDRRTVIDAGVAGNDARFINHSCDPNCESVIEGGRVFIEALRDIAPGTELTYDYQIQREDSDPDNIDEIFACHCGFAACRGTMLWPTERRRRARRGKKSGGASARKRGAAPSRAGGKSVRRDRRQAHARRGVKRRATRKRAAVGKRSARGKPAPAVGKRSARAKRTAAGKHSVARQRTGAGKRASGMGRRRGRVASRRGTRRR